MPLPLRTITILILLSFISSCNNSNVTQNSLLDTTYTQKLNSLIDKYSWKHDVVFTRNEFVWKDDIHTDADISWSPSTGNKTLLSFAQDEPGETINSKWSFWTPATQKEISSWLCTGWLIYDPCIKLTEPIRANGKLRFGSSRFN